MRSTGRVIAARRRPDDPLPVDDPLGVYVRAELLPDGRWRMTWRGFE